jgi:phosphopantothenoylcysteine decarboxylase/phosphopantothenate--cysteine ligase
VRVVTNRSSGKMGYRLAEVAWERGADVVLISGPVALPAPIGVRRRMVETTKQLEDAVREELAAADVLVMAAAPADFRPRSAAGEKIHREGQDGLELDLEPTEDILAALAGDRREGQTVVGFAAETSGGAERAREKLERKRADAIVLNDVARAEIGFESEQNEVVVVERGGDHHVPLASKDEIAEAILDRVDSLRSGRGVRPS